jgi:hypothetical protein
MSFTAFSSYTTISMLVTGWGMMMVMVPTVSAATSLLFTFTGLPIAAISTFTFISLAAVEFPMLLYTLSSPIIAAISSFAFSTFPAIKTMSLFYAEAIFTDKSLLAGYGFAALWLIFGRLLSGSAIRSFVVMVVVTFNTVSLITYLARWTIIIDVAVVMPVCASSIFTCESGRTRFAVITFSTDKILDFVQIFIYPL